MSVICLTSQLLAVFYSLEYTCPTGYDGSKIQGVLFSIRLDYIVMDCFTRQSKHRRDIRVNRILRF